MPNDADHIRELERKVAELMEKNFAIAKWAQEFGPLLTRLGDMLAKLEARIASLTICVIMVAGTFMMLPARPGLSKANFDRIEDGIRLMPLGPVKLGTLKRNAFMLTPFRLLSLLTIVVLAMTEVSAQETGYQFRVESNLRAGVAKVDITPPADTPVVGHVRPTNGVRDPIRAGVLLLDNGETRAAIVTLDLINTPSEMVSQLREAIADRTKTPIKNILVAASHNHSGPGWSRESGWGREMVVKITAAAADAAKQMRPVTIGYGEDRIDFNINRRKVVDGRAVVRLNPDGPCDHRVKVLRLDDGKTLEPMAVLMHAVCHPCVFTWGDKLTPPFPKGFPKISADFPGEAQTFVEKIYGPKTHAMFLQGCAGDIRPNLPGVPYRCGDEADIKWTGRSLGCAVVRAVDRSVVREELAKRKSIYPLRCATSVIELPGKKAKQVCEMQALRVGDFLLLTIPGEPMVEYGFKIEKAIADRAIPIVIGYANGHLGYICTAEAHKYGGYEPNMSPLLPEAEPIILAEVGRLADRVLADVFESFKPVGK